ncbi:hypothetical protein RB601_005363 [Gaeumannomyces tritici]
MAHTSTTHLSCVDDLIRERASTISDAPLITYPNSAVRCAEWVEYTARDLDTFVDEAAKELTRQGLVPKERKSAKSEVVALLGHSDLDYAITILALTRMGFAVLFLSTRLHTEAYVSLLDKCECFRIVTTSKYADTVRSVRGTGRELETFDVVPKAIYGLPSTTPRFEKQTEFEDQSGVCAFIVHSSGSTGLPKPIFQTHRACLSNYQIGSGMRAFVTLPLFHNSGLSTTFRGIVAGRRTALYNAAIPITNANMLEAMRAIDPQSFNCVPYVLKILAETEEGIRALARCKVVVFAGSGCPDDLGDLLVDNGVPLIAHYGQTEMGQLMMSSRDLATDKTWNWLRPLPTAKPYLVMEAIGEGMYELVVLDGLPSKVMSNCDTPAPNSYRTRDTFEKHPTMEDVWKHVGRLDDRLTLVNGEKVLPVPMENRIRLDERVQDCVVFGAGRAFPGLIVVRSENVPREWTDEQYLDAIWPTIQSANEGAEKFSQIDRDMVQVLGVDTEYPRTDKGTIIRAASYKRFASLIDALYVRFEGGPSVAQTAVSGKRRMGADDWEPYLLNLIHERLGLKDIGPDTDFFNAGMDSLQAIMARGHMMRQLDLGGAVLGQNVMFEHPSVRQLTKHLTSLVRPESSSPAATSPLTPEEEAAAVMRELVHEYGQFEPFVPGDQTPDGDVVLLTGATGSLGAHMLSQLLAMPHVGHVYCLVRAPDPAAAASRVFGSLSDRGLGGALTPAQAAKVVALPADLSREADLGLGADVYARLRASVTSILHVAWAVNFNLGVRSFAPVHIAGVRNLLRLALSVPFSQPARFSFVSSISAAAGTPLPARVAESFVADPRHAQGMGYARSKWVAEHVVRRAAEEAWPSAAAAAAATVPPRVLRTGQVVGDSREGRWNATEAIPLMIQAAETMGCLPRLDERPSWIPVDVCARAVVELSGVVAAADEAEAVEDPGHVVYHVLNPRTFDWTAELLPALRAAGLAFEEVGQHEWVARLRAAAERGEDPARNPTLKLLDFFAGKYDNDRPGRRGLAFETEKTERRSAAVAGRFDVIGAGLMRKCVESWRAREWAAVKKLE